MSYAGFFINLDRSADRKAEVEAEFARCGAGGVYKRFPAVKGNALGFPNLRGLKEGELGCFSSHYKLLEENLGQKLPLHVVEDDVVFSSQTASTLRSFIASGALQRFDLVYTDVYIPVWSELYRKYKKLYDENVTRGPDGRIASTRIMTVDMAGVVFAGTSSFLINSDSIRKLHDLYEKELKGGATQAIDLFIRRKAHEGEIRVGCLFPFVTSINLERSLTTTIGERYDQLSVLAANLVRHSFFIEADLNKCLEYAKRYLPAVPDDPHRALFKQVIAFALTDQFIEV